MTFHLYSVRNIHSAIKSAEQYGRNLYVYFDNQWMRCFRAETKRVSGKPLCVLCGNGSEPQWRVVTSGTCFEER